MLFLGTTFCSGKRSLLSPPTPKESIDEMTLYEGTYRRLYLSSSSDETTDVLNSDQWTDYTQAYANFTKGSLEAGNTGFNLTITEYIAIRRREKGEINWNTIFVKKINDIGDFSFTFRDSFAKSETNYEYCISSYMNGVENSYIIGEVYSEFAGFYIADKDSIYGTVYNVDGCNTTRNIQNQSLGLLNNQYMNVVSNSSVNCDSGSITGTFLKIGAMTPEPNPPTSSLISKARMAIQIITITSVTKNTETLPPPSSSSSSSA